MTYRYFVAPFVGKLQFGRKVEEVSKQLEGVINHYAEHGWEFVEVAQVDMIVAPGCLAALLGAKESTVSYNQVIFRQRAG
jgi:hypothetical protein